MTCRNQHIRADTLIIRPKSSDSADNFTPRPGARTDCGEEVQGGRGHPTLNTFLKTQVRVTINLVLLRDSGLSFVLFFVFFPLDPLKVGPQVRSKKSF